MLKNVRIEPKAPREKHEDIDKYTKSSDITEFNLYDQDYETLVDEGLDWIFASRSESERLKRERELTEDAEINT
ncbi:hypothetical protein M3196_11865 [Fictibacillus nanhaiensis]|uniref:hypothetical protein n=1 Tax=Fictibacillus nanhaiensis TaxID=742169 RepID=UPI0020417D34|nr:hypothetical protein [Fictibacillus nanhaiensis]MCM3732358.1 hypothetical protein [Fictibacillus nanhaiensis]